MVPCLVIFTDTINASRVLSAIAEFPVLSHIECFTFTVMYMYYIAATADFRTDCFGTDEVLNVYERPKSN